jgi:hypothetical protein
MSSQARVSLLEVGRLQRAAVQRKTTPPERPS